MRNFIFLPGQRKNKETDQDFKQNINVRYIPTNIIISSPCQTRKNYDGESIIRLADSIRRFGIIQPLGVRRFSSGKYEIVFGERRFRAAKLVDLQIIPCIILENISRKTSCELAYVENSLREPLNYSEQAENIEMLIRKYNMNRNEVCENLSMYRSEIAFLLDILHLSQPEREMICTSQLTVAHLKPILKIDNHHVRQHLMKLIIENDVSSSGCETFIEEFLKKPTNPPERKQMKKPKPVRKFIIKDIRIFMNSIDHAINMVKNSGIDIKCDKSNNDDGISYNICVQKRNPNIQIV